jgi:beta-glucanase (GH16 family)
MTSRLTRARLLGALLGLCASACSDDDAEPALDAATQEVDAKDAETAATQDAASGPSSDAGRDASASGASDASAGSDAASASLDAGKSDAGTASDAGKSDAATTTSDAAQAGDATSGDAGGSDLPGWKLVWSDEFDGAANAKLDPSRWVYETGGTGWGNNQLEFDTDRPENASTNGMGQLVITARKEAYMGRQYTGARLKTQGKFEHGYGRYEARMQIPFGQGIWPAFWMLGKDIGSAGWPGCGEIDIMENVGKEPDLVHGTIHGPGYSGGAGIGASNKVSSGKFADAYHVFAIEWEKDVIRWYVDGKLYQTRAPKDLPGGAKWVFDHDFFILLNLAVGGQWPGNPDETTTFPQTLKVDYVRVYDRAP